ALSLREGLPAAADGLRLGDGLGAAGRTGGDHRDPVRQLQALGLLRGGGLMAVLTRPESRTGTRIGRLMLRRPPRSRLAIAVVRHSLIICALVIMLYPLLWMVAASFRPGNETFNGLGLLSRHY